MNKEYPGTTYESNGYDEYGGQYGARPVLYDDVDPFGHEENHQVRPNPNSIPKSRGLIPYRPLPNPNTSLLTSFARR